MQHKQNQLPSDMRIITTHVPVKMETWHLSVLKLFITQTYTLFEIICSSHLC